MGKSGTTEKHDRHLLRILRPLIWWLILVLVLFGIHTHERLMEKTRLNFSVSMQGQPIDAAATFDGKSALSGQNIPLGNHTFAVTNPKGEPFSTNMFIWYGPHDLGNIVLKRAIGNFTVTVTPPARWLIIRGPEWSVTLMDSSGTNATVPTDVYAVEADFSHWQEKQQVMVNGNFSSPLYIAPRFGIVQLDCNQTDASYQLQDANGQNVASGSLPAMITELPMGSYSIFATHHGNQRQSSVFVKADAMNTVPVNFEYGAAIFETAPSGAVVADENGRQYGETPLILKELLHGTWKFTLQRYGYAPLQVALHVTANQTNSISTNLVSFNYITAMNSARQYLAESNYKQAGVAVDQAIQASPADVAAVALQRKITVLSGIQNAEFYGAQSNYTTGIKLLQSTLQLEPDNERAKQLLIDYQKREPEQIERERQERLNQPREYFAALCAKYRDGKLFNEHELKTKKSYHEVQAGISEALLSVQPPFVYNVNDSPTPGIHEFAATQKFSTGLLSSGVRMCLIVVGQTKDDETQILFKVLEYERHHKLELAGPQNQLTIDAELIPLVPSSFPQMSEQQTNQLKQGVQTVMERIQQVIGQ
jgi:hypothetical protein